MNTLNYFLFNKINIKRILIIKLIKFIIYNLRMLMKNIKKYIKSKIKFNRQKNYYWLNFKIN